MARRTVGGQRTGAGRTVRTEGMVQISIMLAIGAAAGAASFTHVHDVAAEHGQPGWLAWADAIVLELMSLASGLELRHRKRQHKKTWLPATVLVVSVALSLSAQVVEAEQSPIGWIAAALPAAGFLIMVKFALGHAVPGPSPAVGLPVSGPLPARSGSMSGPPRPRLMNISGPEARVVQDRKRVLAPRREGTAQAGPGTTPPAAGTAAADLEEAARSLHAQVAAGGHRLTRRMLAEHLRKAGMPVSNVAATQLVRMLNSPDTPLNRTARSSAGPDV